MATRKPTISTSFLYETFEETLDIKPLGAKLHIGIPKETAFQENRIALTPEAVGVLVSNGNEVSIEHLAGEGSHYSDADYSEAGAKIVFDRHEIFKCPILVKSAPIVSEDLPLLQLNQIIISPIHYSALQQADIQKMMEKKITALSFENFKDASGTYPIVRSMSEIAGSAVMLIAAQYLSSFNKGKGVLLGGISGIPPTKVVIVGAGIVGESATRNALALGASVKVFDNDIYKLKQLQNNLGQRVWTSVLEPKILAKQLKTCEVAVGALASQTGRTPLVVTEEMVSNMRPGSVVIDIAAGRGDNGSGNCPLTQADKVVNHHGVKIVGYTNLPSMVAADASALYARNLLDFMKLIINKEAQLAIPAAADDDIVAACLMCRDGQAIRTN